MADKVHPTRINTEIQLVPISLLELHIHTDKPRKDATIFSIVTSKETLKVSIGHQHAKPPYSIDKLHTHFPSKNL